MEVLGAFHAKFGTDDSGQPGVFDRSKGSNASKRRAFVPLWCSSGSQGFGRIAFDSLTSTDARQATISKVRDPVRGSERE